MRRDDGPLAREYNIHRIKEQGRIAAVEPHGEQQQPTKKPIPEQTKAQLAAPPCSAPYTSTPERGHKASRRNNPRLSNASNPIIHNPQPPSKPPNTTNPQPRRKPRQTSPTLQRPQASLSKPQPKSNAAHQDPHSPPLARHTPVPRGCGEMSG